MKDRASSERNRVLKIALAARTRSPADPRYLESLAQRLAADAVLPLDQARRRVAALAISAAPRTPGDGFRPFLIATGVTSAFSFVGAEVRAGGLCSGRVCPICHRP